MADMKSMKTISHCSLVVGMLCGLSGSLITCPAADAQYTPFPVSGVLNPVNADVLGVKLYMPAKDVFAILKQRLNASASNKCNAFSTKPGVLCFWTVATQLTPGKQIVGSADFHNNQLSIHVTFSEVYPFDPQRPEAATKVEYHPNLSTAADRAAFVQSISQKYGPSLPGTEGVGGNVWCTQAIKIGHNMCAGGVPTLYGDQYGVSLGDPQFLGKEEAAWEKKRTTNMPPL
jgi:hypothetical protein